jgi:hypothetical protein
MDWDSDMLPAAVSLKNLRTGDSHIKVLSAQLMMRAFISAMTELGILEAVFSTSRSC